MSKIKLPHASGNSMSIGAPATNPSGDLELKLPATIGTNGQYLTVDGSGNLVWANPPGITGYDTFSLTTDKEVSAGSSILLDSDFSRNTNFPSIGSAMTHSSGAFTFPTTGIWELYFQATCFDTDPSTYTVVSIQKSTDSGGSWSQILEMGNSISDDGGSSVSGGVCGTASIDVTNVSTVKVKFLVYSQESCYVDGHASQFRTGVIFKRLGDT